MGTILYVVGNKKAHTKDSMRFCYTYNYNYTVCAMLSNLLACAFSIDSMQVTWYCT